MAVINITKDSFKEQVLEEDRMILLEFWASGNEACEAMDIILEEISAERADIKVCRINSLENPVLSNAFRIKNLPTIALMADGTVIHHTVGVQPKSTLISMITKTEQRKF